MSQSRFTPLLLVLGLGGGTLPAQQYAPVQPEPVKVAAPVAELPTTKVFQGGREQLIYHPFLLANLVLTLKSYHLLGVGDFFDVRVDNPSKDCVHFDIGVLGVVDATGCQLQVAQWTLQDRVIRAVATGPQNLLPGVHVNGTYLADAGNNLKFPARVYFGDRLLAEIRE